MVHDDIQSLDRADEGNDATNLRSSVDSAH